MNKINVLIKEKSKDDIEQKLYNGENLNREDVFIVLINNINYLMNAVDDLKDELRKMEKE